jgi:dienelactone hydrolase
MSTKLAPAHPGVNLPPGYRIAFALALAVGLWPAGAVAAGFVREDLRIAMPAAGPRGLEALLVRADEPGRHPLVLINHGSPRDPSERPEMTPLAFLPQAIEFARRGWAAAIVMRRGFGDSGGGFAEGSGPCQDPNYLHSASEAAADLNAAIGFLAKRSDIDAARILSVGVSAGGFATVALTAEPPAGLVAGVSFAGGRGSDKPDSVCRDDKLIAAFGAFGKRSRLPMLWVYAENDHFFGPALAQKFREAFTGAGGKVAFVKAAPFGDDGHHLFSTAGTPQWAPMVDDFLKAQNLVLRSSPLPPPQPPNIPIPRQLSANGRKAFEEFLTGAPHKAFAMSPTGAYGRRFGRRTIEAAKSGALANCPRTPNDCRVIVVDDTAVP